MKEPTVVEFTFDSSDSGGTVVITIQRQPDPIFGKQKPRPDDLPEDIRQVLSSLGGRWLRSCSGRARSTGLPTTGVC